MSERDREELGKTVPRTSEKPAAGSAQPGAALPVQPEGRYAVPDGVQDPELGRGGMGRVLRLTDTHLEREVAVKELLPEHTAARSPSGSLLESLFVREARVLARLEHPGVVPVYELGRRADGTPYYSMRRIRGQSLLKVMDTCATLDDRLALLSHFIDVVQTIGYAHSRKVVHRDLKPENVMVSRFGETQVIDWGLAVVDDEAPEGGVTAGTPAYMSPEQASGTRVDPRSDVWALGVMLFELLTGKLPFRSGSPTEVINQVQTAPIPRATSLEPHIPAALVAVIDKALQRDPSKRYQSAGEMADALEAAQRARAPRPTGWIAAFVALAVLAVGALAWGVSLGVRLDDTRRDARLKVGDAERDRAEAFAAAALSAWRARDVQSAKALAERAAGEPLARGVSMLVAETGAPERAWSVKVPAGCSAVAVAGDEVLCATLNGVALFGAADGAAHGELSIGPRGWQHAVVALDASTAAFGGDDRVLHVFEVATKKEVRAVSDFASGITAIAPAPDGILVGQRSGEVVRVRESGDKEKVLALPSAVLSLAASPVGFAATSNSKLVAQLGDLVELDRSVGALAFGEGARFYAGVEREVVALEGQATRWLAHGHLDDVKALALLPGVDGAPARLVSGADDGTVRWWFPDGSLDGQLSGFEPGVTGLAATKDGRVVVATQSKRLEAWKLPAPMPGPIQEGVPSFFAYWQRGWVVTGYRDGHVRRYDVKTKEGGEVETRHTGPVRGIAEVGGVEAPEAFRHLTGGDDGQVLAQRWNGSVEVLDAQPAKVTALAVTKDGTRAAWAYDDGARVLWSLQFGKEIVREKDTLVRALRFSPDGRTLAVARDDKRVALLETEQAKEKAIFEPIDAAPVALTWTPDGALLVAGSTDGRVTTWDVAAKRVAAQYTQPLARVSSVDVSADGRLVAAASDDGSAWVWLRETGQLYARIPADAGDALLVSFVGDKLLTVGTNRVPHWLPF